MPLFEEYVEQLEWSEKTYAFKQFLQEFTFPQIVKVMDGYYSPDEEQTIGNDEILTVHAIKVIRELKISMISRHENQLTIEMNLPILGAALMPGVEMIRGGRELKSRMKQLKYVRVQSGEYNSKNPDLSLPQGAVLKLFGLIHSQTTGEEFVDTEDTNGKVVRFPTSTKALFAPLREKDDRIPLAAIVKKYPLPCCVLVTSVGDCQGRLDKSEIWSGDVILIKEQLEREVALTTVKHTSKRSLVTFSVNTPVTITVAKQSLLNEPLYVRVINVIRDGVNLTEMSGDVGQGDIDFDEMNLFGDNEEKKEDVPPPPIPSRKAKPKLSPSKDDSEDSEDDYEIYDMTPETPDEEVFPVYTEIQDEMEASDSSSDSYIEMDNPTERPRLPSLKKVIGRKIDNTLARIRQKVKPEASPQKRHSTASSHQLEDSSQEQTTSSTLIQRENENPQTMQAHNTLLQPTTPPAVTQRPLPTPNARNHKLLQPTTTPEVTQQQLPTPDAGKPTHALTSERQQQLPTPDPGNHTLLQPPPKPRRIYSYPPRPIPSPRPIKTRSSSERFGETPQLQNQTKMDKTPPDSPTEQPSPEPTQQYSIPKSQRADHPANDTAPSKVVQQDWPSDLSQLSVGDVGNLMSRLLGENHAKIFMVNLIDGNLLTSLTENDLRSLELPDFHCKKMMRFLNGWRPKL